MAAQAKARRAGAAAATAHPSVVSVIIVCWNNQDLLEECFDSIYRQTYPHWNIVVVDNGSTDDSVDYIEQHHPKVTLLKPGKNLGFAVANNQGIARAFEHPDCHYVLLLNTDARLRADWMEKMVAFAHKHPRGAAFQSLTLDYYNHHIIDSCGILIDRAGLATQMGYRLHNVRLQTQKVFGVNAAAALYSRAFLDSQPFGPDYFDSDLFMYLEDVDLAARSVMLGWDSYFVNETEAYHMGSASSGKNPGYSLFMTYRNNAPVLLKNLPAPILKKLLLPLLQAELNRIRGFLYERKFALVWQIIKGRLRCLPMLPLFYAKRRKLKAHWAINQADLWELMTAPKLKRLSPRELGADNEPITVVLLARNHSGTIASSLDSLLAQSYKNVDIVVVDNGSTDGTDRLLAEKYPQLTVITNTCDFGTAGGFNEGIVQAQKDLPQYVALARAGCIYDRGWLQALAGRLDRDVNLFAASSQVTAPDGQRFGGYNYQIGEQPTYWAPPAAGRAQAIFAPTNYGSLYRADSLIDTGLFDGEFFNCLEEVDLAFRARLLGQEIFYEPAAQVTLEEPLPDNPRIWYAYLKNGYYLYIKNVPFKLLWAALPGSTAYGLRSLGRLIITGHLLFAIKALLKMTLKTPRMLRSRFVNQHIRTQKAANLQATINRLSAP